TDANIADASIHIFDPSIELEAIKARPAPAPHHAFRGQVTRLVLTSLRNAKKPLTTQDIAMRVMAERGLDTANVRLLKTMTKRAGACLQGLQKQGGVTRQPGPGRGSSCCGSLPDNPQPNLLITNRKSMRFIK